MKLSEEEARHFFDLMFGLQFYANQQLGLTPSAKSLKAYRALGSKEKLPTRNAIYEHPEVIDAYLKANPNRLSADDRAIVAGWKKPVRGKFFIERILKKYTVLIKDDDVYGVLGLFDSFDEMFYPGQLPVYVEAVLLAYKGQVVYDGLLLGGPNIYFGGGIKSDLKEIYLAAKQNGRIITSLEAGVESGAVMEVEVRPDYSSELAELNVLVGKLRAPRNGPPVWSPAFRMLRVALDLAEQAVTEPDDIEKLQSKTEKIVTALNRMETVLYRSER
ncbi:MAG: hypothetical protein KF753_09280 [Caldilineaceae bacterium]|nr:hypothetical protein [Caldilineaceae bacterium]